MVFALFTTDVSRTRLAHSAFLELTHFFTDIALLFVSMFVCSALLGFDSHGFPNELGTSRNL